MPVKASKILILLKVRQDLKKELEFLPYIHVILDMYIKYIFF